MRNEKTNNEPESINIRDTNEKKAKIKSALKQAYDNAREAAKRSLLPKFDIPPKIHEDLNFQFDKSATSLEVQD